MLPGWSSCCRLCRGLVIYWDRTAFVCSILWPVSSFKPGYLRMGSQMQVRIWHIKPRTTLGCRRGKQAKQTRTKITAVRQHSRPDAFKIPRQSVKQLQDVAKTRPAEKLPQPRTDVQSPQRHPQFCSCGKQWRGSIWCCFPVSVHAASAPVELVSRSNGDSPCCFHWMWTQPPLLDELSHICLISHHQRETLHC